MIYPIHSAFDNGTGISGKDFERIWQTLLEKVRDE
jgi:hypothetical protein